MKDVNNVHLVCRNLHQIANLHVNPKLRFYGKSPNDPESLVKSSRIFEKFKFGYDGDEDEKIREYPYSTEFSEVYFVDPEKFEMFEKFISFTGPHIKDFSIKCINVDPKFFQMLLNLLPNLEALELFDVQKNHPIEESIKWALKSSKIKRIKIKYCAVDFGSLLESLEKCVIEEAELDFSSPTELETVQKFLKSQ